MKTAGTMMRRDEVEFFLRLHGLWEGIITLPPEDWWRGADDFEWQAPEPPPDDGQVLVLDAEDPFPADE